MDAHVVSARRRGLTDTQIDAIGAPEAWDTTFDERELSALHLADALCGPTGTLAPGLVAELRERFGERELAELILVAGQANLNNRVGNAAKQVLGGADAR